MMVRLNDVLDLIEKIDSANPIHALVLYSVLILGLYKWGHIFTKSKLERLIIKQKESILGNYFAVLLLFFVFCINNYLMKN